MNKIFRKAIVLALAGSALLYVGCTKDYSGDIQTLRNEFEQYKSETNTQINTLNGQLSGLRTSVSALENAKEQTELAIDQLKNRATALETFKQNAEAQFASLEGQISGINSEISAINGRLGQIDGQIAGIYANISDLQKADEELAAAIELAKARIQALEDNTYTKQEVDGKIKDVNDKIDAAKAWAEQTFATKELVATIDGKLAALTGVVDAIDKRLNSVETDLNDLTNAFNDLVDVVNALGGDVDVIKNQITDILKEIENIKDDIKGVKEQLATVKETADTALEKANQALTETQAIRDDLVTNYYKAEKVDALLSSLKNSLEAQINAEVANRIAGDEKANERIDSLAKVTKAIEEDLANFKTETSKKLLELENKINEEITNRVAFQTAQEVKNAALDQKDAALEAAIAAIDAAYKAADKALNDRCDALADRCFALEGRATELENKLGTLRAEFNSFKTDTEKALSDLRDDLNTEIKNREDADLAINQRIDALQSDLNTKYAEIKGLIADLQDAIDELDLRISIAYLYIDYLCAAAERIQSVVFVPEYDDFRANLTQIFMGNEPVKNIVSATFEVQPAEAIVYVDSLIKENAMGNKGIGLAVKELKSRAVDADEVIYDVTVSILDDAEHPGRFVIEAFLDPEVFDEEIAISCVLGDYEVGNWYAGNGLQSTFVGTYAADEVDLFDTYVWFDETQELALDDSLGVEVRIPYTQPAEDSLVFNVLEDVIAFRMNIGGAYKTIKEVADWLYLDENVLTPVGDVKSWITKDAGGHEVNGHMPFELEDFAPETSLTTTKKEGEDYVDPMFVHYTTARKEIFKVGEQEIAPFAFVGVEITKNQVPAFDTDPYEIPWSYVHPIALPDGNVQGQGKVFEVDGNTEFGKAIEGAYSDADENFTKDEEAYTPGAGEDIAFIPADAQQQVSGLVKFFGWAFEAADVNYMALTERFETESDDYEINVPFVLKKRADDRDVEIDLGELSSYRPSADFSRFIEAVVPAFNGEEEYFIGDAAEFAAGYEALDSLYSAYANQGSQFHTDGLTFAIDSVYVNGERDDDYIPYLDVDLAWDVLNSEDASVLSITSGKVPYGAEVVIYGRYTEFGVNFDYVISFTTPECPYTLVLTPYDKFDPTKDRTIIVEGDDVIAPDLYTLEQMYYSKYLRVVDQAAYKEGKFQKPSAEDIDGNDLEVRFTYAYEDLSEFGEGATEADRGYVNGAETVFVITDTPADYGYLNFAAVLTWGDYNGLKVTVTAELVENGIVIQTLEDFYIETEKPIALIQAGVIGADQPLERVSGYPLEVNVAQDMVIAGILSRGPENQKWYIEPANYGIFSYMFNNVCQENIYDPEHPDVLIAAAGDLCEFYQLDVEYDWENITATLNGVEWDLHMGVDYVAQGNVFTLLADSGKGTIIINVPIRIRYYLDYCGAKAVDSGVITINVLQI